MIWKILAVSLGLTLIIETGLGILLGLRGSDLRLTVLMNLMTNPLAVFTHLCLRGMVPELPLVLVIEVLVVLAEGVCLSRRGEKLAHPWRLAVVFNCTSFFLGEVLKLIQS